MQPRTSFLASLKPGQMQRSDNLLNLKNMTLYKGYECYRNRLTKRFYAMPIGDDTFLNKVTADSPDELKRAIDLATANQRLNPWELPYATAQAIAT